MRVEIWTHLPMESKKAVRLCCQQFKLEIDSFAGLAISVRKPFEERLQWLQSLKVTRLTFPDPDDEEEEEDNVFQGSELLQVLDQLTKFSNLKIQPQDCDLIPVLQKLRSKTFLKTLELDIDVLSSCYPMDFKTELSRNWHLHFPYLRALNLTLYSERESSLYKVFSSMQCPNLRSLKINIFSSGTEQTSGVEIFRPLFNLIATFAHSISALHLFFRLDYDLQRLESMDPGLRLVRAEAVNAAAGLQNVRTVCTSLDNNVNFPVPIWMAFLGALPNLQHVELEFINRPRFFMKPNEEVYFRKPVGWKFKWYSFCFNLKFLLPLRRHIKSLTLQFEKYEVYFGPALQNLEFLGLPNLESLTLAQGIQFRKNQWNWLKTQLKREPPIAIEYRHLDLSIDQAEDLGTLLAVPNFKWHSITVYSDEDMDRALTLCRQFGIPQRKVIQRT